jgi:Protein of unknown function (DUF3365)
MAVAVWASSAGREGPSRELLRMHDDGVLSFVNSEGFGKTRLPPMSGILRREVEGTKQLIVRIELIGIARHNPPRVFSDAMGMSIFHIPDKKDPRPRAASRAMTEWERQALRDLDAGERLVIRKEGRYTTVVGPIRAGDECLGCHKKQRAGDMLGALVYSLAPLPAEPSAK